MKYIPISIAPSDVYDYSLEEIEEFLTRNSYKVIGFRPPNFDEFYLDSYKASPNVIQCNDHILKDDMNPRLIVERIIKGTNLMKYWE